MNGKVTEMSDLNLVIQELQAATADLKADNDAYFKEQQRKELAAAMRSVNECSRALARSRQQAIKMGIGGENVWYLKAVKNA